MTRQIEFAKKLNLGQVRQLNLIDLKVGFVKFDQI